MTKRQSRQKSKNEILCLELQQAINEKQIAEQTVKLTEEEPFPKGCFIVTDIVDALKDAPF
jgi:hypothetical protein